MITVGNINSNFEGVDFMLCEDIQNIPGMDPFFKALRNEMCDYHNIVEVCQNPFEGGLTSEVVNAIKSHSYSSNIQPQAECFTLNLKSKNKIIMMTYDNDFSALYCSGSDVEVAKEFLSRQKGLF